MRALPAHSGRIPFLATLGGPVWAGRAAGHAHPTISGPVKLSRREGDVSAKSPRRLHSAKAKQVKAIETDPKISEHLRETKTIQGGYMIEIVAESGRETTGQA